eukprot:CAMPEP_0172038780 /NCGR_PEP_ID=MMETSP1041-20130122/23515_1 /TAXON_ID=464988 /ORGANISM="Hemiselmis andersenii, Strain CCMP439" /LENGTH=47 /DNA_ID= /DNA_START= /DNA_END= /DNA_ORIENTATION=
MTALFLALLAFFLPLSSPSEARPSSQWPCVAITHPPDGSVWQFGRLE